MDWKLTCLAFVTLFIAELGDKTQLAVISLVTDRGKPGPIFIGASLALVVVTLLGAYFGGFIVKFVPIHIVKLVSGLLFAGIGIYVLLEAVPAFIQAIW